MRVDFNGNGFSASMNENQNNNSTRGATEEKITEMLNRKTIKQVLALVFAIAAVAVAFALIPFGLLAHTGIQLLDILFFFRVFDYATAYVFLTAILSIISAAFGVISCVLYKKNEKTGLATAGLVIAILSFVINGLGLFYNLIIVLSRLL